MSTIVTSVSSARPPSTPLGPGAGSARGAVAVTALAVAVLVAALAVAGGPTTTVSGERTRTADPNAAVAVVPAETIVRADGGRATPTSVLATGQALGGPGTDPLAFVRANAGWYGLTDSDLAGLATVRDTASPGGSLRTVTIEQRDGTRRVLGAALKLTLDADGRVLLAAGTLAPAAHATSPATVEALTAVAVAAREVGRSLPTDLVSRPTAHGRVFEPPRSGPDQAITAEAVTLPATGGTTATPGWVVTLHADGVPNEVVVDATTGDVVAATQQAFHTGPQATVFLGQDPTVGAPTTVPLVGAPHNLAGWVTDDTTIGNNADAREDANGDDVADYRPTTPPSGDAAYQHFDFPFTDAFVTSGGTDTTTDRDFTITQAFYRVNWLHDYYYALGFDEAAGNFQTDNFGRGGVGGDPMLVDVHDNSGGRSFTQSPPDGGPGRITLMAPVGAVDHALDMDLVTHEYTHAVTNRLVNNGPLPKGVQTWALGESWSDFFSTSMWDDPIAGEYVCQNATNGCLLGPYDTSTLVYSDLCTLASGTCEVHRDGEIFTAALWDLRQLLTTRLGAAAGRAATEQLVFDGVRATSPALATFLDARDAIVAADLATTGGANTCLVWAAFAEHEMGLSASTSADQETVTPATDVPAGCVPTADAGGPYAVGEGDTLVLDATGSSPGTDPSVGATSYRWDLDEDGDFDDASGATPTFPATGDDIVATVAVQVSNEGGVTAVATAAVVVSNVEPIVAIDPTGLVDEAGDPVVVQGPGGSATLTASATDPGSDDLVFTWDPGDGTAPQSHMSLVNPPVADPPASPTHQPRAVTDTLSHTWLPGCTHTAGVLVTDDDGGTSTTASGTVVAVGTATTLRGTGWWKAAWRPAHPHGLDPSERDCLVAMVTVLSTVWTGPAGTNPLDPVAVLKTAGSGGDAARLFDRALLTAWLNLAAGALDPAALVDLDGDGVGDTAVFDLLATAEQARLDPTTSRGALLALKDRLEALSTT